MSPVPSRRSRCRTDRPGRPTSGVVRVASAAKPVSSPYSLPSPARSLSGSGRIRSPVLVLPVVLGLLGVVRHVADVLRLGLGLVLGGHVGPALAPRRRGRRLGCDWSCRRSTQPGGYVDSPRAARTVELLSRAGCHLCDDARRLVERVTAEAGVGWTETDVDADPALRAEFGDLVPVVRVDGKELGYWRIDEGRLRRALG